MTKLIELAELKPFDDSVLAYGHFSVIHLGHLRYLRYAKAQGKRLVVALIGDGLSEGQLNYPFTQLERSEALSALNLIDHIILLEGKDLSVVVSALKPNKIVLGTEYESTTDPDIRAALSQQVQQGREIEFHSGETHYSSTELLSNSEHQIEQQAQFIVRFFRFCVWVGSWIRRQMSIHEFLGKNRERMWFDFFLEGPPSQRAVIMKLPFKPPHQFSVLVR